MSKVSGWWLRDCGRFEEYGRIRRVKIDVQKFIASRIMTRKLNGNNYLQLEEIAEINLNGHGKNNHIYTDLPTSKTDE